MITMTTDLHPRLTPDQTPGPGEKAGEVGITAVVNDNVMTATLAHRKVIPQSTEGDYDT